MADRKQAKPKQAADKLAFLLALVPYLMDHDRVSVPEVAAHFGVSEAEIRDAVNLIAVSGIPGATGTYQHNDLFDVAWDDFLDNDQIVLTNLVAIDESPRFSGREAAALIAGLQYLSALPENTDRSAIATLMAKLSRGASAAPTQLAVEDTETDATLAVIRESVAAGVQVEFGYRGHRGEAERRRIDPLRIESLDADWYVRGWCHLREAVRTFRLDRISDPHRTDAPITHHSQDVTLPDSLFEVSLDDLEVTLELSASALPLLEDYIRDNPVTMVADNRVRAVIRVSHLHGLKRLIASMPGVVTVVGPPEARAAVADWAAAGAARYR
ncbi:MAG TPA: WYL domain-containing protein [Homoserinimonas sp.]|nr:WYL domain-containing protein [Homoserinimonas sp.]